MKQLIIEACLVNYGDDRGGVDHAAGDVVDVPKAVAVTLATNGRALYVNKADDPNKDARHTASKDMLKAAEAMLSAKQKAVQTSAQSE